MNKKAKPKKDFPGLPTLKYAAFDRKFTKARNTKWIDSYADKNVSLVRNVKYKFFLSFSWFILELFLCTLPLLANTSLPSNIC